MMDEDEVVRVTMHGRDGAVLFEGEVRYSSAHLLGSERRES